MDASAFERALRRRILGVLAVMPVAAVAASACGGGDGSPGDGGADVAPDCTSCFCGAPIPPGPTFDVTYTVCPPIVVDASAADAADDAAADDAATDAADAAADAAPPGVCFYDCMEACMSTYYQGGNAQCLGETPDAGDAGTRVAHCQVMYLCGRRLEGLVEPSAVGETLARMAWLEAASIRAFRRLARELGAHGAPRELVHMARRCARDEARHARTMARLARHRGATVPRVEVDEPGARDLEAIARENAIEACVGETFGALLAAWHSERAREPDVRAAMREIAPDELRHAALGWAVAAWLDGRLPRDARDRVRHAREQAVRDLLHDTCMDPEAGPLAARMNAAFWGVA